MYSHTFLRVKRSPVIRTSLLRRIPTIFTCNADQDPRKYKDVSDYIQASGVVVVEIDEPLYSVPESGGFGGVSVLLEGHPTPPTKRLSSYLRIQTN
jgi:hypothetical protein